MSLDPTEVARAYIAGCGAKQWEAVSALLAPSLAFAGPGSSTTGAGAYLAILKRLGPVWVRSDVKQVFATGAEVCVIYDMVTDSPAGAVPIVEWLRIQDGRIASVTLFFDRVSFKPASDELLRRAALKPAGA